MPKTSRILSYLPGTFQALPRPTALYAVVDAFGRQLLQAENSLAAIMQAHWVDTADRNQTEIHDLALIAALYGLAPREDEGVEAFREHLKRYVRTFLEGTITVQGILRVSAEALGLHIADSYEDLDSWWMRPDDTLVTVEADRADAAALVLGLATTTRRGQAEQPARIGGSVDLQAGVDLRQNPVLRLKIDDGGPVEVDLTAGAQDSAAVTLAEMIAAVNDQTGSEIASADGPTLLLTTPTTGADSRLAVEDDPADAADLVLGLAPRLYSGSDATAARVTGSVDLAGGVDLRQQRYLRLRVDGAHLAEIDCAGANIAATTLDEIRDRINDALALEVASHDGHALTLTSPTTGRESSITFLQPAAQNATTLLFGPVPSTHTGRDPRPAQVTGRRDLAGGVDLSQESNIRIRVDGAASVTVDCAGEQAANTQLPEIVNAINDVFGQPLAGRSGRYLRLTSPTDGAESELRVETALEGDATPLILGFSPRNSRGENALPARLVGSPDLSGNVNLMARYRLRLAVDGHAARTVDLRSHAADPRSATLAELVAAINEEMGGDVATHDGLHLILLSPTRAASSRLVVEPVERETRRRFVTRAAITDEAALPIFGFVEQEARGTAATAARVRGNVDLSRGVDLREGSFLRLVVDDHPPLDVDVAGPRPRATLLEEIVRALNDAAQAAWGLTVAAHDGRHLILTSPTTGGASRVVASPPRAGDALPLLGLAPGLSRGAAPTTVIFEGTADLTGSVDLSSGDALRLAVDGADPVTVHCAGVDPAATSLNEVVIALNLALGAGSASHNGRHLILSSRRSGEESEIAIEVPEADDATARLLGITPPRRYQGRAATPATVTGDVELDGTLDLSRRRYLRVGVDGAEPVVVDGAAEAADPAQTTPAELVAAVEAVLGAGAALLAGDRLQLRSPTSGLDSRLLLEAHEAGDARSALLGDAPHAATGEEAIPATITGDVALRRPVDLSERRWLRLVVNDGRPLTVDVAGAAPGTTFLDEIVAAIDAVQPGIATATADARLQLTAPATEEETRLQLLPLRYLELLEYPPHPVLASPRTLVHGDGWALTNDGAAPASAELLLEAPQGVAGPTLVNSTSGWSVRLLTTLAPGESARVWAGGARGLQAEIRAAGEAPRPVPGDRILAGRQGAHTWVPFNGVWQLGSESGQPAALQLDNPLAPDVVRLQARQAVAPGMAVAVAVREHDLAAAAPGKAPGNAVAEDAGEGRPAELLGRVQIEDGEALLYGEEGELLAHLRAGVDHADPRPFAGRVVAARGMYYDETPPLLVLETMVALFDVTLRYADPEGTPVAEHFRAVTIGGDPGAPEALVRTLQTRPSALVTATSGAKGQALEIPRGRSRWRYLDCHDSRFNNARFDGARFAGGLCADRGVFNVSRFARTPPEPVAAVFAAAGSVPDPAVQLTMRWQSHRPGAICVGLPADLPARFGGRFNETRFGARAPESYAQAVTEPEGDPAFLEDALNAGSSLVEAQVVARVPLGFEAVPMPFRTPQPLRLGSETAAAALYLAEEGIDGFLEIRARHPGVWGNEVQVAARAAGPALYDVSVIYPGAPFERGRAVVAGDPVPALSADLVAPGQVGVLQAKAAGIRARVGRERTESTCST